MMGLRQWSLFMSDSLGTLEELGGIFEMTQPQVSVHELMRPRDWDGADKPCHTYRSHTPPQEHRQASEITFFKFKVCAFLLDILVHNTSYKMYANQAPRSHTITHITHIFRHSPESGVQCAKNKRCKKEQQLKTTAGQFIMTVRKSLLRMPSIIRLTRRDTGKAHDPRHSRKDWALPRAGEKQSAHLP